MEPMFVYTGMGLLFVFLVILTMDISGVRERNRQLDDEIYDLKHTIWGDSDESAEDDAVGLYYSHKNLQNRVTDLETVTAKPVPKAKKAQKKPLAKKR
jgi:Na+-transporting methylmalonyl-CoA/oxaloacetate decarboxylase gamma subunit